MSNVKVKKLKKGVQVGEQLPIKQSCGNIGRHIEKKLSKNYKLNKGKGVDLPVENIEVKTRKEEGKSYQSVATMPIDDIISTSYNQSNVHDKFQRQYRVKYKDETSIITEEQIYDFSDTFIQDKIKEAYENGRTKIINGDRSDWVYGSSYGSFERPTENSKSYTFRISNGAMKKLENMAKDNFGKFFDIE
jgi:hypothetical protein